MTCKLERQGNKGILYLSGDLTIAGMEELKDTIKKALKNTDELALNINNVASMDVAFLQMICSAHRAAQKMKKDISLSDEIDPAYKDFLMESGFLRGGGCKAIKTGSCFFNL